MHFSPIFAPTSQALDIYDDLHRQYFKVKYQTNVPLKWNVTKRSRALSTILKPVYEALAYDKDVVFDEDEFAADKYSKMLYVE